MKVICGTGHRPLKLPGGYSQETFDRLVATVRPWLEVNRPDVVISGMALGFDMALAVAALDLGISVIAYIPFIGQGDNWPKQSHVFYGKLLKRCAKIVNVSLGGYSATAMQDRNVAMVDASDLVLALWDGSSGGTGNAVRYAESQLKEIENLWEQFTMDDI